jgi:transcriptional regulator with XRE-family HTH domain
MDLRNETRHSLGSRLKELRQRRKLSRERLGDLSGLSRNYVNDVENGHRSPGIENVIRLAHAVTLSRMERAEERDSSAISTASCSRTDAHAEAPSFEDEPFSAPRLRVNRLQNSAGVTRAV